MIIVMSKEMDEAVCDIEGALVRVRTGARGSPLASKTGPYIADEGYRNSTPGTDGHFVFITIMGLSFFRASLQAGSTGFDFSSVGNVCPHHIHICSWIQLAF